ncbi:MAG: hypothetical protein KJZ80_06500 [Hyphomicrobiaceae bacterium]|nr:hypothetical protein [Hyphomicrobiaceae bacterium]
MTIPNCIQFPDIPSVNPDFQHVSAGRGVEHCDASPEADATWGLATVLVRVDLRIATLVNLMPDHPEL